ncbi:hypothetical protein BDV93DRAFT_454612 [Ceratobasidium sp. AG-I]|nr:hypothetical protein BDV93DRAFT_454612 [Ceratobasidium sp. AG-I]
MNSSAGTSVYRITPLRGTNNYNTWRIQMEDILTDLALYDYKKWMKSDRKALTQIRLRVDPHALTHIQTCKTSKEAWDLLANTFRVLGTVGLIDL